MVTYIGDQVDQPDGIGSVTQQKYTVAKEAEITVKSRLPN